MSLERDFQRKLKRSIKERFPGCEVMKTDSGQVQGIPDLLILYKQHWALLETKRAKTASKRMNQDYYVNQFNDWSFSAFVDPNNMEDVLDDMERSFERFS